MKEVEVEGFKLVVNGVRSWRSKRGETRQVLDVYIENGGACSVFLPLGRTLSDVKGIRVVAMFGRLVLMPVFD